VIRERPGVIGGLISAATTVMVFGFIVVTQPRGGDVVAGGSSSLTLAAPVSPAPSARALNGSIASAVPSAVPSVTSPVKPKIVVRKSSATTTQAAKPKNKAKRAKAAAKTQTSSQTTRGGGGPGTGRIQFGKTYTGQATFYGATGAGNCSFEASSDLMVGAMNEQDYENSQACGAYLSVTGPNGKVTIRIVDRCPECPPGAIDLSQQAFAKIAPVSAGRVSISWRLLSPAGLGSVAYRYKTGSSQYWCGIQVRNHRNPVRSLQVKSGNTWKTLARQNFNYFISEGGAGCGGAIRITDIYGNRITSTGIRISPDVTQRGKAQFPAA
jgi:expansin (peptidoglycan-binding protein)